MTFADFHHLQIAGLMVNLFAADRLVFALDFVF